MTIKVVFRDQNPIVLKARDVSVVKVTGVVAGFAEQQRGIGDLADGTIAIGDSVAVDGYVESGYTMPKLDGLEGYVLQTDGAGSVTFTNAIESLANEVFAQLETSSDYTWNTADLNGDGAVTISDLLALLSEFGNIDPSLIQEYVVTNANESQTEIVLSETLYSLEIPASPDSASATSPYSWNQDATSDYIRLYHSGGSQVSDTQKNKKIKLTNLKYEFQKTANTPVFLSLGMRVTRQYPTQGEAYEDKIFVPSYPVLGEAGTIDISFPTEYIVGGTNFKPFNIPINGEYPYGVKLEFKASCIILMGQAFVKIKDFKINAQ